MQNSLHVDPIHIWVKRLINPNSGIKAMYVNHSAWIRCWGIKRNNNTCNKFLETTYRAVAFETVSQDRPEDDNDEGKSWNWNENTNYFSLIWQNS
jgi:hypothetical protein